MQASSYYISCRDVEEAILEIGLEIGHEMLIGTIHEFYYILNYKRLFLSLSI